MRTRRGGEEWQHAWQAHVPEIACRHAPRTRSRLRHPRRCRSATMHAPSDRTRMQQAARRRANRQPHAELARPRAHRERQHARDADDRDQQRDAGKSGDDERVQPLGRQHFRRARPRASPARSTGWFGRHLVDDPRHRRHERIRDRRRRARTAGPRHASAAPGGRSSAPARARRSHRPRRRRRRRCGAAAACRRPDRSTRLPVRRASPFGEQPLRDALADDDDRLAAGAVVVGEVAAGDERHAEHREEARRDDPQPRVRVLFAVRRRVALDGERRAGPNAAGVAPRHEAAERDALDAGQRRRCAA